MGIRLIKGMPVGSDGRVDTFDSFIRKAESGCWLWTGWALNSGYGGYTDRNGRNWPAHRYMYAKRVGDIPPRYHVCHKCDVKLCVNPEHLFIGTAQENIHDMQRKGRWKARQPVNGPPECHPERAFYAKGMCQPCYKKKWRIRHAAP